MVDTTSTPPLIDEPEPQEIDEWDITGFPGIMAAPDRSDPASTSEASDEGADPSFEVTGPRRRERSEAGA